MPPARIAAIQLNHDGLAPEIGAFNSALIQSDDLFQLSVIGPVFNTVVATRQQWDGRIELRSVLPNSVGVGSLGPGLPMMTTNIVTIILQPIAGGVYQIVTAFRGATGKVPADGAGYEL